MINISVIKLILNTYIIKKRVYKRKRKARKVKEIVSILPKVYPGLGQLSLAQKEQKESIIESQRDKAGKSQAIP
jgi:hypothetical protein